MTSVLFSAAIPVMPVADVLDTEFQQIDGVLKQNIIFFSLKNDVV